VTRKGIIWILIFGLLSACKSDEEVLTTGKLALEFRHVINGSEAVFDQMIFENEAGNTFELTNIQWFISDIALRRGNGEYLLIEGEDWFHYVDSDIPQTHLWEIQQDIPAGTYTDIRFTFGIKGEKNMPNRFTNPPESNMLWPYHMGGDEGGYHYMKLNGFWLNVENERQPFNFHIGVGQEYDLEGNVTDFIQNWFEKELPVSLIIGPDKTTILAFIMNIQNWFKNPHVYDHNEYGGKIMDNQEAMGKIKENGENVFNVEIPSDGSSS
jgi:hypothetical protein